MRDLNEVLSAGATDVGRTVRVGAASAVRARGDRRRTRLAAMSAVAVGAVAAVGAGAVVTGGGPLTSPGTRPPPQTVIPAALKMPHEGERGWRRDNSRDTPSPFTGCGSEDPTLRGRTAARTMTGYFDRDPKVPTEKYTEQFFLFRNERAAKAAMAALQEGVLRCGWWYFYNPPDWQVAGWQSANRPDNPVIVDLEEVHGIRLGNAIFLIYHKGTHGTFKGAHGPDLEIVYMMQHVCAVMRLCPPESPDGSPTPTGFPWPPGGGEPTPIGSPSRLMPPPVDPSVGSPGPQPTTSTPAPRPTGSARR